MRMLYLTTYVLLFCAKSYAIEDVELSDQSINKINHENFSQHKSTFAESPSLFKGPAKFDASEIAFEERKMKLTQGDIIKISEDLTFSYDGDSTQVAEEDFIMKEPNTKVNEAVKKGFKFDRK